MTATTDRLAHAERAERAPSRVWQQALPVLVVLQAADRLRLPVSFITLDLSSFDEPLVTAVVDWDVEQAEQLLTGIGTTNRRMTPERPGMHGRVISADAHTFKVDVAITLRETRPPAAAGPDPDPYIRHASPPEDDLFDREPDPVDVDVDVDDVAAGRD